MHEKRMNDARQALLARQKKLVHRRNETLNAESELLEPEIRDSEDRAVNQSAAVVLDALSEAELGELRSIKAALARIEAGIYGACVACGQPIDRQRLELLPAASHCRACGTTN